MAYTEVVASSVSNETIASPGFTDLDGEPLTSGVSLVLLINQTTATENGVWRYHGDTSPLTRPAAGDQFATLNTFDNSTVVWVQKGAVRGGTVWAIEKASVVEIDTHALALASANLARTEARYATTADISLATPPLWVDGRTVADGVMDPLADPTVLTCLTSRPFTCKRCMRGRPVHRGGAIAKSWHVETAEDGIEVGGADRCVA